jgi:hypothetical protein
MATEIKKQVISRPELIHSPAERSQNVLAGGLFVQQHRNIRRTVALPVNQHVLERLDIVRGTLQVEAIQLVMAHSNQHGVPLGVERHDGHNQRD